MSIFGKIWNKLNDPWGIHEKRRGEKEREAAAAARPASAQAAPAPTARPQTPKAPPASAAAPAPAVTAQPIDVQAVLTELAAKKGGGGNWRTSIVDLLKLLDLDSSLAARKELAEELGVRAGDHGSAEQNMALQKAVLRKLAENGGKVPKELLD
jgi:hypothetical protein